MIFITENKNVKYIKKLNKDLLNHFSIYDLKALSFTELKNANEITSFVNNCINLSNKEYSIDNIRDKIVNNGYLAYIYYKNNEPLGFLIAYITKENSLKSIKINDLGILKQYQNKKIELKFIQNILLKAFNSRKVDQAIINFNYQNDNMKKIMKELNFDKALEREE